MGGETDACDSLRYAQGGGQEDVRERSQHPQVTFEEWGLDLIDAGDGCAFSEGAKPAGVRGHDGAVTQV